MAPRYTEQEAREAIAASGSFAEALRRMGMCSSGNGYLILAKWAAIWRIPTDHFDSRGRGLANLALRNTGGKPLSELLVEGRYTKSATLKERLYEAGLKERRCEMCGQGEDWRGGHMSLILDHVNGERLDNRIENLRIVCPNCNATLDTHCGRNARLNVWRDCEQCGEPYRPKRTEQRFCSNSCARKSRGATGPRPEARRVERPPLEQLLAEVKELGWSGTGRKYGVSDNAIRKWVRAYEAEREVA